jgi:quinol monooxygenase YgiN
MDGKVTVIAIVRAKSGKEQEVKKILLGLRGPTRAEKGCINYDLHQSLDDPALFMFHENWASQSDLEAHSQSPHLQDWRKRAPEMIVDPTKATRWFGINNEGTPG